MASASLSTFLKIPFRRLENPLAPLELISPEQIGQLHQASMHILENIGLELWRELLADYQPPPLDPGLEEALRVYVEQRSAELEGQDLYG